MSQSLSLPIIAIVGRPNVGKSTLFNRFAGRRRALVEDTPGLTRDRIAEEIQVSGRSLLLVDTAGLDPEPESGLDAAVQAQARAAVAEADAILFVVDGQAGLLPEDAELARTLRRASVPLCLCVNKIDIPAHEPRLAEFHRLGIERTHATSGEHGRGAFDALEDLVAALPEPPSPSEPQRDDDAIRVAVVGRPNVGKSSLVNRLLGSERVVVSEQPGTTRDAVDTRLDGLDGSFVLIDTAGMRRPSRRDAAGERASALMAVRSIERADVVLLLIDAAEGFRDQDARIAGLVRERGRAAALLANKWDLVDASEEPDRAKNVRDEIGRGLHFMPDTPVLRVSAKTGAGVKRILPSVSRLASTARTEIGTSELNRWLADAVARHEPAMAQRGPRKRPVKFYYATQTGVSPPTFVLFCSGPEALRRSYLRFLENRLRERFDLEGTPVRLQLRRRDERVHEGG